MVCQNFDRLKTDCYTHIQTIKYLYLVSMILVIFR